MGQLLQAIGQRDQRALLALYEQYANLVYSLALQVVQEPASAEEVTQDIFVKLWQHPERWNPELGQFSSWLLTMTRNAAIDRLRRERRVNNRGQVAFDTLELLSDNLDVTNDTGWYDGQVLRRLIARLPVEQQQVVEMAFYQGFTHSELAERLALPLGTVKTRLRIGLQKLRVMWLEETNGK